MVLCNGYDPIIVPTTLPEDRISNTSPYQEQSEKL